MHIEVRANGVRFLGFEGTERGVDRLHCLMTKTVEAIAKLFPCFVRGELHELGGEGVGQLRDDEVESSSVGGVPNLCDNVGGTSTGEVVGEGGCVNCALHPDLPSLPAVSGLGERRDVAKEGVDACIDIASGRHCRSEMRKRRVGWRSF